MLTVTSAAICILMITTTIQGYNYGGSLALAKNENIQQVRIGGWGGRPWTLNPWELALNSAFVKVKHLIYMA